MSYAGLDPQTALNQWSQTRQMIAQKYGIDLNNPSAPQNQQALHRMTPQDSYDFGMERLAQENPAAWQLNKTGYNDNGQTRTIRNQNTGAEESQKDESLWSHPETWLQIAAAGGLAAPYILPALGVGGGAAKNGMPGDVPGNTYPNGIPDATGDATSQISQGVPGTDGYAPGNSFPKGIPSGGDYSGLIKALAGMGGLFAGHALNQNAGQNNVPPQLSQLLDMSVNRATQQQPLFNAVNSGLYQMLPNFAKPGGQ